MKPKLLLILLSLSFSTYSQSLVSPTGASFSTSNYFIEYAIGEPCIQTISNTGNQLTEGLLQPDLFYKLIISRLDTLRIPNSFSPNGDGINDRWIIKLLESKNSTIEIFNRFGQNIFVSKGYFMGWDGRFRGRELPIGVYYYLINIPGSTPHSGWLLLIK
jgi:gliding motility-associated-like protein